MNALSETLEKAARDLRENTSKLEEFEFGKLTLVEIRRAVEKAHMQALIAARVMRHVAQELGAKAEAERCCVCGVQLDDSTASPVAKGFACPDCA